MRQRLKNLIKAASTPEPAPPPPTAPADALLDLPALRDLSRQALENEARLRCHSAYLGDHQAVCRVLGRYHMFVDTQDTSLAPHMLMDGFWESWITMAMMRHLGPGMRVIDVGANLGYYTLLAADAVGETGQVYAIEPLPEVASLLRRSVGMNGFGERTRVVEAVATDEPDGQVTISVPGRNFGSSSIAGAGELERRLAMSADQIQSRACPTVTLDRVVGSATRVDLIKLDAEGAEPLVWRGMRGILEHSPHLVVVMEYCEEHLSESGALLRTIEDAGFALNEIATDGSIQPITIEQLTERPGFTMLWLARQG